MTQKSRKDLASTPQRPTVPEQATSNISVEEFLARADQTPVVARSPSQRLVFALDATMSREATWDLATSLQADMFIEAARYNGLDVQLVYFRGANEVFKSAWSRTSDELVTIMSKVRCRAGRTQLAKVLRHILRETQTQQVRAFVFVGDSFEEDEQGVFDIAGKLGILGVRGFFFQEDRDPRAEDTFRRLAKLTNGAYAQFDLGSAAKLRDLLRAAAAYAAGGVDAVKKLNNTSGNSALLITEQLSE